MAGRYQFAARSIFKNDIKRFPFFEEYEEYVLTKDTGSPILSRRRLFDYF